MKSALFYSNTGKTILSMDADMGDGNGLRSVNCDKPFSVTYQSTGNKSFIIRYTFSDGSALQTHGKIAVNFSSQTKDASDYYLTNSFSPSPNPFTANQNHMGGTVTVRFGLNHTNIQKPIIVAEGFDSWKIMYPNDPNQNMTIDQFLDKNGYYKDRLVGHVNVSLSSSKTL